MKTIEDTQTLAFAFAGSEFLSNFFQINMPLIRVSLLHLDICAPLLPLSSRHAAPLHPSSFTITVT